MRSDNRRSSQGGILRDHHRSVQNSIANTQTYIEDAMVKKMRNMCNYKIILCILGACINSAVTEGYNGTCMFNIGKVLEAWVENKTLKEIEKDHKSGEYDYFDTILTSKIKRMEAAYNIGTILGSALVPVFNRNFGRKGSLLITNFISIFGVIFCGYSKFFFLPSFVTLGRVLFGISCGVNSALAPIYITELMPKSYIGRIGAFYSLCMSLGGFFGKIVSVIVITEVFWPLIFSLNFIPIVLQLSILPFFPESPKYTFVIKNRILESNKAVICLRGQPLTYQEHDELIFELSQRKRLGDMKLMDFPKHRILLRALLISSIIVASPALSGARLIVEFVTSGRVFGEDDLRDHQINDFLIYGTFIVASILSILTVNVIRRQWLLFVSFAFMSVTCCAAFFFVKIYKAQHILILILMIMYAFSLKLGCGCIACFIPCEYFNTSALALAFSIGNTLTWLVRLLEVMYASILTHLLDGYLFLNYGIINAVLAYFAYHFVLDTRNKPLDRIYLQIRDKVQSKP